MPQSTLYASQREQQHGSPVSVGGITVRGGGAAGSQSPRRRRLTHAEALADAERLRDDLLRQEWACLHAAYRRP